MSVDIIRLINMTGEFFYSLYYEKSEHVVDLIPGSHHTGWGDGAGQPLSEARPMAFLQEELDVSKDYQCIRRIHGSFFIKMAYYLL